MTLSEAADISAPGTFICWFPLLGHMVTCEVESDVMENRKMTQKKLDISRMLETKRVAGANIQIRL